MKIGIKPIIGGATGNRTLISWETVRYNSRYIIAPDAPYGAGVAKIYWPQFIRIYLLCLLFMLKKSLATKPHILVIITNDYRAKSVVV